MKPNQIFTHPGQPEMQVEVILASKGPDSPPLYTVRMRYPRIIHSELMTHRVFSRNARSSRAVPVKTMLEEIRNKPFIPWHWGKNQKGMQAGEDWDQNIHFECEGVYFSGASREQLWLHARDTAADVAEAYMEAGYHKQIPNRLLEPFMWIDVLVTATDWSNFLWLRDHKDAEPHLQDLARLVHQALDSADIQELQPGQWHLPYITDADVDHGRDIFYAMSAFTAWACKISAARCARISYKPFDGDSSYERELGRYNSLVSSDRIHASPLEHQATPERKGYWADSGHFISDKYADWDRTDLHGNLTGWFQYRKTIPGERR